jgi:hypothetical protein
MKAKQAKRLPVRQGDVLIYPCEPETGVLTEIPREHGAVVLAHGEVTGHSHAIRAAGVCHLRQEGVSAYTVLRVSELCDLVHEEHATISLAPGDYRVVIQQEYTPEELRDVQD